MIDEEYPSVGVHPFLPSLRQRAELVGGLLAVRRLLGDGVGHRAGAPRPRVHPRRGLHVVVDEEHPAVGRHLHGPARGQPLRRVARERRPVLVLLRLHLAATLAATLAQSLAATLALTTRLLGLVLITGPAARHAAGPVVNRLKTNAVIYTQQFKHRFRDRINGQAFPKLKKIEASASDYTAHKTP